jgi:hypothetical protein
MQKVIEWLLAGDAAIRWQALRDVEDAPENVVRQERERVVSTGWGARILKLEGEPGIWGGGLYTPKWTSTTYTLLLLRSFGLESGNAAALRGCRLLLDRGLFRDGGINLWKGYQQSETCVTAMVLSLSAYFGVDEARLDRLAVHLLEQQMPDGGWNCRSYAGATHGSFHTTISALEALEDYRQLRPEHATEACFAAERGREFLLAHRLYRSHRTGEVANPVFTRFVFPPRWHYDILRALDYFQACRAKRDPRLEDAIGIVRKRRRADGRWSSPAGYPGRTHFELEPASAPSRWNTLRAMRVLKWWGD